MKKVINLDTGETYDSALDAINALGLDRNNAYYRLKISDPTFFLAYDDGSSLEAQRANRHQRMHPEVKLVARNTQSSRLLDKESPLGGFPETSDLFPFIRRLAGSHRTQRKDNINRVDYVWLDALLQIIEIRFGVARDKIVYPDDQFDMRSISTPAFDKATNTLYNSVTDAARAHQVSRTAVLSWLAGEVQNRTNFVYVLDDLPVTSRVFASCHMDYDAKLEVAIMEAENEKLRRAYAAS